MAYKVANINDLFRVKSDGAIEFGTSGAGTDTYVLSSAGANATPTWTEPTTGTVKGTGTATRVAFWSANDTITSDADLYWDNTNKRLGIGKSPSAKLEVSGDTGGVDSIVRFQNTNSTAKNTRIQLLDSAGTVGDALIAYDHSNASALLHYLGMGVNNSTTLVINNSDNIGIGTDEPAAKLDISTGTTTDIIRFGPASRWGFSRANSDSRYVSFMRNQNGSGTAVWTVDGDNGKVGIGTVSPDSYDGESNDLVVASGVDGAVPTPGITIACLGDTAATGRGALRFADGTSSNAPYRGALEYNHDGDDMSFRTSGTIKMSIGSSGDVKITTNGKFLQGVRNTGSATLDMIGFASGTDTLQIKGGTSGGANAISFYDTGGFLGTWYNSNFGIGATSPSGKLEVAGGSTLGLRLSSLGNQSAYDQVRMTYSGYNGGSPTVTFMPLTTPGSGNAYTTFLFQNTNGINASSNNNANVAIDGTLQVGKAKGLGETTLIMNNYDDTLVGAGSIQNSIRMSGRYWSGSASQLVETRINSVHQESNGNGGSALTFWTQTGGDAPNEKLRIDKSGRVIVYQKENVSGFYLDGGNTRLYANGGGGTDYRGIECNSSGMWSWGETGISNYFAKPVGIGVTSPAAARLNVVGVGQANNPTVAIDVTNSDSFNHGLEIFDGNLTTGETVLMAIGHSGSTKLTAIFGFIRNENSLDQNLATIGFWGADNKLTVSAGGNVGIGTGTGLPAYKLEVSGNIRSSTLTVYDGMGGTETGIGASGAGGNLRLYAGGTNKVTVTNTAQSLIVYGNSTTGSNYIQLNDSAGTSQGYVGYGSSGNNNFYLVQFKAAPFNFYIDGAVRGAISTAGTLTMGGDVIAYGSPSDKRLKENIKPIISALDKVSKLQGVTFDWKDKKQEYDQYGKPHKLQEWKNDIGFIAQDVQKVIPELVRENDNGMLSMRHQGVAPILLEAIKELKAEIEELKKHKCNCSK
jgi:hypothetical protein